MKLQIITLFQEYFTSPLSQGLLGKAVREGLLEISFANPRDWGKSGRVDDYPFGGGESMVMSYPPLKGALDSFSKSGHVVCMSPQGEVLNFRKARAFSNSFQTITLVCGRYGGIDERFIAECVHEEISIGDYILNGGEAAALVFMESLFRFLPKALGNSQSIQEESFEKEGLLQGPQWTRPKDIEGHTLPQFLFSGHHKKIQDLRLYISLVKTCIKRPELLSSHLLGAVKRSSGGVKKTANGGAENSWIFFRKLKKSRGSR